MNQEIRDWASFWNTSHSIYVSPRHFDVHYRDIANHIIALLPKPGARVLDYGCGQASHADRIAAQAGELWLCDAAANVRARLQERFAANPKIKVLAPEAVEQCPAASIDLIVANSVAQYLSPVELDRLLGVWRKLLAPGGDLVIGDVIPPACTAINDALALLRYAAREGFLLAAAVGLLRTILSPYRRVRAKLGITRYAEGEFIAKLARAGFTAERLPFNLEHNAARMSFRARAGLQG